MPHRSAPMPRPIIPSTAGIPRAISAVTVPRSLHDDGKCTADQSGQNSLHAATLEDEGKQSGEAGGGNRCDGVFRGYCAAFCVNWRDVHDVIIVDFDHQAHLGKGACG